MVTFQNPDGTTVEFDAALFREYQEECFGYLREMDEQKQNLKAALETLIETTGIDKKVLTKYIKESYKAKSKETIALGEAFAAINEAIVETLEIVRD